MSTDVIDAKDEDCLTYEYMHPHKILYGSGRVALMYEYGAVSDTVVECDAAVDDAPRQSSGGPVR